MQRRLSYFNKDNNNYQLLLLSSIQRLLGTIHHGWKYCMVLSLFSVVLLFWVVCHHVLFYEENDKTDMMMTTLLNDKKQNHFYSHDKIYTNAYDIPMNELINFDAILILGGGAPHSLYEPPIYVQNRCDDAVRVSELRKYAISQLLLQSQRQEEQEQQQQPEQEQQQLDQQIPFLSLSAGTTHVPQLMEGSSTGLPVWESTSSSAYLHGYYNISYEYLFVETTSYDTIGNAYFTRTSHTDINGWRNLLIITNRFHIERSKAIFDWIFSIPVVEKNKNNILNTQQQEKNDYRLYYLATPDDGITDLDVLTARYEKEQNSLRTIQTFKRQYTSLQKVYHFLTQQHDLYTAKLLIRRAETSAAATTLVYNSYTETFIEKKIVNNNNNKVDELIRKSYGG